MFLTQGRLDAVIMSSFIKFQCDVVALWLLLSSGMDGVACFLLGMTLVGDRGGSELREVAVIKEVASTRPESKGLWGGVASRTGLNTSSAQPQTGVGWRWTAAGTLF